MKCDLNVTRFRQLLTLACLLRNRRPGNAEGRAPEQSQCILWPNAVWTEGARGSKAERSCRNERGREAAIDGRVGGAARQLGRGVPPPAESALGAEVTIPQAAFKQTAPQNPKPSQDRSKK